MAHWRTMAKSENFCAADLWDNARGEYVKAIVKIVKVSAGEVVGQKGRKKGMPFLWLEYADGRAGRAAFGANPTNCKAITAALGTPDVQKWVGQWIGLYVTKVDSPEGLVDAIRVHPQRVPPPGQKSAPASSSNAQQSAKASEQPADATVPADELTEEDKRAIEMAEREEANRGR